MKQFNPNVHGSESPKQTRGLCVWTTKCHLSPHPHSGEMQMRKTYELHCFWNTLLERNEFQKEFQTSPCLFLFASPCFVSETRGAIPYLDFTKKPSWGPLSTPADSQLETKGRRNRYGLPSPPALPGPAYLGFEKLSQALCFKMYRRPLRPAGDFRADQTPGGGDARICPRCCAVPGDESVGLPAEKQFYTSVHPSRSRQTHG